MRAPIWYLPLLFGLPWYAQAAPAPGDRIVVSGQIQPVTLSEVLAPIKTFRATFLVVQSNPDRGWEVVWLLEELTGEPRWYWPQRFGRLWLDREGRVREASSRPVVLAAHRGAVRGFDIPFPYLASGIRLEAGSMFAADGLRYVAEGMETVKGKKLLRVVGRTELAVREVLWVDPATRQVVRRQRRVFLGQGVPHRLVLEVQRVERLSEAQFEQAVRFFDALEDLRPAAGSAARPEAPAADPKRREALEALAARLIAHGGATEAQVRLLNEAIREQREAEARQQRLSSLAEQLIGRPAPALELQDLRGRTIRLADLRGKVVVLHFWEYAGEQIEAPYGEVGYLDFLHRKLSGAPVAVLGVSVYAPLKDRRRRSNALRAVARFARFMNLSYPVLLDSSGVIDRFGDPRRSKAALPLYVVIDREGKVAAYHVGPWSNGPDVGLAELTELVKELLEQR